MARCLKVYEMIDNFMKIFKLINMKVKIDMKMEGKFNDPNNKDELKR
jgi:hypothetical protein